MSECWHCNATPHGHTNNIGTQIFRDGALSNIKLNQYDPRLLTSDTWNIPDKGADKYTVIAKINYCPMCGRGLAKKEVPE